MKRSSIGFTLVETIVATGILAVASGAIATLFISSVRTNFQNQQRTFADLLLSDKIEQLSTAPLTDPQWAAGDHVDYVSVSSDGIASSSFTDSSLKYLRSWQVSGAPLRTLTVVVYDNHSAVTGHPAELIRAVVAAAPRWAR